MRERGSFSLIAIDPGKMTGAAHWDPYELRPKGSQSPPLATASWVSDLCECAGPGNVFIICEAFVFSQRTLHGSFQPDALEVIGMMRFICSEWGQKFVEPMQQASAAKKVVTNDVLKRWGWHIPGKDHANDALRHLGLYSLKHGFISL